MAWSGFGEEARGESGLELSLGLPAYFTKPSGQAGLGDGGSSGAGAFALQPKERSDCKTRPAAAPVVGWPPVRSFRRNLASSKPPPSPSSQNGAGRASKDDGGAAKEDGKKQGGLFVKINMDGVPIGRKVDLMAYGGYAELSSAVDELFRGLLAGAQRSTAAADGEVVVVTGGMDGSGKYRLVYEDDEGDMMLVGDDPWQMFIARARRLRVLKSSDLPPSSLIGAAGSSRTKRGCCS